jgi:hypothetical protein
MEFKSMLPKMTCPVLGLSLLLYTCATSQVSAQQSADEKSDSSNATTTIQSEVSELTAQSERNATNPASAGGMINEQILELLGSVSNRVDTTIDRATDARDAAEDIRDRVSDGVDALDDQLRDAIDGALDDLRRIVAVELGGAEFIAFTDGPNACSPPTCQPFRQELLTLLDDLEASTNGLFAVTGLDQLQIDFARMRSVIQNLPGRALFPLYVVLKLDNGNLLASLSSLMTELNADLSVIEDVFATEKPTASAAGPSTPICNAITTTPGIFEAVAVRNAARAIALKVVAKIFDALGETSASADAGIHGYVHITYKENFPKKFAAILEALSDAEFYIAEAVNSKLEFCLLLQVKIDAQQHLIDILTGQTQILDAIAGNADLNYDGEVNLLDFAIFQRKFGSMAH